ncbi:MAG: hypothetical protein Q8O67_14040 [Deltaproteobacteria bacterium]|nr:hypothetical protein [Deltaproteobacteria bacterium]
MDPGTIVVAVMAAGTGAAFLFRKLKVRSARARWEQLSEHRLEVVDDASFEVAWRDAGSQFARPGLLATFEKGGVLVRVSDALLAARVNTFWGSRVTDVDQTTQLREAMATMAKTTPVRLDDRGRPRPPEWTLRELAPGCQCKGSPSETTATLLDDDGVAAALRKVLEGGGIVSLRDGELTFTLPRVDDDDDEANVRRALDLVGAAVEAFERVCKQLPGLRSSRPRLDPGVARREALVTRRLAEVMIEGSRAWFDEDEVGNGAVVVVDPFWEGGQLRCTVSEPALLKRVHKIWARAYPPLALHNLDPTQPRAAYSLGIGPFEAQLAITQHEPSMTLLNQLIQDGGRLYATVDEVGVCAPQGSEPELAIRKLIDATTALVAALEAAVAELPELDDEARKQRITETSVSSSGSPFAVRGLDL